MHLGGMAEVKVTRLGGSPSRVGQQAALAGLGTELELGTEAGGVAESRVSRATIISSICGVRNGQSGKVAH